MLDFIVFIDMLLMGVLASTIFVLRRQDARSGSYDGYTVPLYPVLPAAYLLFLLAVLVGMFVNDVFVTKTYYCLVSLAIMVAGYPLLLLCRRLYGADAA
jgi:APA family basic amino acid/polyamine antiporter